MYKLSLSMLLTTVDEITNHTSKKAIRNHFYEACLRKGCWWDKNPVPTQCALRTTLLKTSVYTVGIITSQIVVRRMAFSMTILGSFCLLTPLKVVTKTGTNFFRYAQEFKFQPPKYKETHQEVE